MEAAGTEAANVAASEDDAEDDMGDENIPKIKFERQTTATSTQSDEEQLSDARADLNEDGQQQTPDDQAGETVEGGADLMVVSDTESSNDPTNNQDQSDTTNETPSGPENSSTIAEYQLRKARAVAGRMRESKKLEKFALESKLRSSVDFEGWHEIELKSKLVAADVEYYDKLMELAEVPFSGFRHAGKESAVGKVEVMEVHVGKAWFDAEVVFTELVLAFPENKDMERPDSPDG